MLLNKKKEKNYITYIGILTIPQWIEFIIIHIFCIWKNNNKKSMTTIFCSFSYQEMKSISLVLWFSLNNKQTEVILYVFWSLGLSTHCSSYLGHRGVLLWHQQPRRLVLSIREWETMCRRTTKASGQHSAPIAKHVSEVTLYLSGQPALQLKATAHMCQNPAEQACS